MSVDNRDPYLICGVRRTTATGACPSASRNRNGISHRDVFSLGGGDGMHFHIDPFDTTYAFIQTNSVTTTSSSFASTSPRCRSRTCVRFWSPDQLLRERESLGNGARGLGRGVGDDPAYRWGWVAPLLFSSVTPGVVYMGANALFKSTDRGGSWKPISGDLSSRVNRDTVMVMGKPIGTVNYSPAAGRAPTPLDVVVWPADVDQRIAGQHARALYRHGRRQVQSRETAARRGPTSRRTSRDLPPHTFVSSVLASKHAAAACTPRSTGTTTTTRTRTST
jgi:hypothetical protein